MKPELRPGSLVRKAGSPDRAGIDQHRQAAFRQGADLADGNSRHVGGECDRFRMKIPAGQDVAGIAEYDRIVRDRIGFPLEVTVDVVEQIKAGTEHLRLAPNAVRVLHTSIGQGLCAKLATLRQRAQPPRNLDLAGMTPNLLQSILERTDGAEHGFRAQGAG